MQNDELEGERMRLERVIKDLEAKVLIRSFLPFVMIMC